MERFLKLLLTLLACSLSTGAFCQKAISRPHKNTTQKQSNFSKNKRKTKIGGTKSNNNLRKSSKHKNGQKADSSNEMNDWSVPGGVSNIENEHSTDSITMEILEESPESIIATLISNMIFVEGGEYDMGSLSRELDERPVHKEKVESFHIGKYEVTQREWEIVMGTNPSSFKNIFQPVENISWDDCQLFIEELNNLTGMKFRLPSEVEWEYAARGGIHSHGYEFSGDNDIKNVACFFHWDITEPNPVGSKKPNELGIYDMTGNVWEWVSDRWCDNYNKPRDSPYFVRRGGSWNDFEHNCRVSFRSGMDRSYQNSNTGFRIAY